MSSTNQIVHVLIPKSSLREDKVMDFDVFVKVSEKFVKVLNQGEKPDMKRIENYLSKKSDVLYIESGVIEKFMDKKFSSIFEEVTSGESMEDRIRSFVRCLELCYLDIKLVRPHPDKFMRLSMLTEASYEFFTDPYRQRFVLKAVVDSIESAISRRALFGASLSLSILCAQSTCPAKTFQSLFVGGILRDIGIPLGDAKDVHLRSHELSPEELAIFQKHPEASIELLKEYGILDDAMEAVIMQHHEKPDGTGFPRGMKRMTIFKPAQNLHISDWVVDIYEQCLDAKTHKLDRQKMIDLIQEQIHEDERRSLPTLNSLLTPALGVKPSPQKAS